MSDQLTNVYLALAATMEIATGKPCREMADWLFHELQEGSQRAESSRPTQPHRRPRSPVADMRRRGLFEDGAA